MQLDPSHSPEPQLVPVTPATTGRRVSGVTRTVGLVALSLVSGLAPRLGRLREIPLALVLLEPGSFLPPGPAVNSCRQARHHSFGGPPRRHRIAGGACPPGVQDRSQ